MEHSSPSRCRLPLPALRRAGALTLRTDLTDAHCYVFDRSALLAALEARPLHSSLKQVTAILFRSIYQCVGNLNNHCWRRRRRARCTPASSRLLTLDLQTRYEQQQNIVYAAPTVHLALIATCLCHKTEDMSQSVKLQRRAHSFTPAPHADL